MTDHQDPEYLLGDTNREIERLRKQHKWFKTCLKNKVVFAPLDLRTPGLKVLDVGCAEGSVLRDLRNELPPDARLVGLDYMPSFLPASPDGNIRYVTGDACEPPEGDMAAAFDLTHVRFVIPGCGRVGLDRVISNLAETLSPGGWLQVHEMDVFGGRTEEPSALNDFLSIFQTVFDKGGIGADFTSKLAESFVKAGLENVVSKSLPLPAGRHMDNESDCRASIEPFKLTIPTVAGAAKAMGARLPESVFDKLEERFEREMLATGGTFSSTVVFGQKPF